MAWIRLDDQIAHHPKFLKAGLSSWLWVCCLGFAQKFLTDGHIPYEAVASLGGCIERPQNHIDKLVKVGLLEKAPGGYQIHDYQQFNESAEVVKKRREYDRVRKMSDRISDGKEPDISRNPQSVLARAPASHPIPSHPSLNLKNKLTRKDSASTKGRGSTSSINGRSNRPIFTGQRIVVFDWMLEDLTRLLGEHTEAFNLHEWFFQLDAEALTSGCVIPQRDKGVWLHAQTLAEAQRRGLPISVTAQPPTLGKISSRMAQALANISAEEEQKKHDPKRLQ